MIKRKTIAAVWALCAISIIGEIPARADDAERSTRELSFLVGSWTVRRVYGPGSDREREIQGSLDCTETLSGTYVFCKYEFIRDDARPVIDDVYFNYNPIYDRFESVWMSATWPIKVILAGSLDTEGSISTLNTAAEFSIEDDVTEYVRDELSFRVEEPVPAGFTRNTHIRTSEYEEGAWRHHMIETATRKTPD